VTGSQACLQNTPLFGTTGLKTILVIALSLSLSLSLFTCGTLLGHWAFFHPRNVVVEYHGAHSSLDVLTEHRYFAALGPRIWGNAE
jgi:hypothetical protein